MFYEVKIFDGQGNLKEKISQEDVSEKAWSSCKDAGFRLHQAKRKKKIAEAEQARLERLEELELEEAE